MSSSFNNIESSLNNEDDWSSDEENNSPDEIKPINELSRYSKEFKELEPLGTGASGKVFVKFVFLFSFKATKNTFLFKYRRLFFVY